jgi:small-conductance mechanosensitive channel
MDTILAQASVEPPAATDIGSPDKAEIAAGKAEVAAEKARLAAEKAELAAEKASLAAEQATQKATDAEPSSADAATASTEVTTKIGDAPAETAEAITEGLSKTFEPILDHLDTIYSIFAFRVFSYEGLIQLAFVAFMGVLCWLVQEPVARQFDKLWPEVKSSRLLKLRSTLRSLLWPILLLISLWAAQLIAGELGYGSYVIRISTSLLNAWVFIRLISSAVRDPFWSKSLAVLIWIIAALNILRLLNPTIALLDSIAVTVGDSRFSLYLVIKGGLIAATMLWLASSTSQIIQGRLSKSRKLTPSVKVLIGQLSRFGLLFIAVVVALNAVGIDLTALAVLSGAVGVGIGFGLQKIVSNLISGIILLSDRSIKPGDVIKTGEIVGWVSGLGARYTAIRTRDGTEHLIPNEELIINKVENWSHSDLIVRRKVPIGIHYDSDLPLAKDLMYEAMAETPRILEEPKPNVLVMGFGDSSIDLQARFWINDPQAGLSNVSSDLMERVWRKFQDNGVEIPYPQRDLHVRSTVPFPEQVEKK